jgi:dipeptidyl aminopeptidase/acylaminoacyl peptidase
MRYWTYVLAFCLLAVPLALAQDNVVRPGDNLVVEGIPPIPASLAETAARYANFRGAGFQDWHPVKREMLISTRFADTNQIHRVSMPGGARYQLTFFPDRVAGAQYAPTTGDSFIFSKDVGGGEWYQIYRYDFSTGAITLLTDGGRSQNSLGVWSSAGNLIAYSSTRRNGKDRDIWIMNPVEPKSSRLLLEVSGGGWSVECWSPDDRQLVVGESISVNESHLWLVDISSGQKKRITPEESAEKVVYGRAVFSKDGKGLYVTTDRESEFRRLAYIELATGVHRYLSSHISWDVDELELSHDGRTIAFIANEDGIGNLHLLDTTTRKERPALRLPAGSVHGLSWHRNSCDLAFHLSSARASDDVYSVDVRSGKVDRWTFSETGGINTGQFSEARLIRWKSFDGRTISGFLYAPPARFAGKRPVIINIHGGPEGQSTPGFLGRTNYYLDELGVALIFPNVRGSTGYGKTFVKLDNGMKRMDSVRDIEALLDWIQTQPDLDAGRIMVTGGSYGGFMTLAVATNYNDRIRCALDVVGISNFVTFLQNTEAYRRDLRRVEYGDERDPEMRAYLEKTAPLNNAGKITRPLFVVQGYNDPRVPYTESEQMVATVRKNGSPVWYLMARDEGHGFAKKKNQDFLFYATVQFVQEFLLK